jgi:hypothetical protein
VKPSHGPHWVGDDGTTDDLAAAVHALLLERPMRFVELLEATGARDNRIKGVITQLQRRGVRVVDVAPEGNRKALWFIPSEALLERLTRVRRRSATRR